MWKLIILDQILYLFKHLEHITIQPLDIYWCQHMDLHIYHCNSSRGGNFADLDTWKINFPLKFFQ